MTSYFNVNLSINGQPYGNLSNVVANADLTKQALNNLTEESSSGLISQTYSGLSATAAYTVLSLNPQVATANAQISEISAASGPMTVQQTALSEISALVAGVNEDLGGLQSGGTLNASNVIANAHSAVEQIAGLLDTQYGTDYVFAGQDTNEAPVPDANSFTSSGFYTQIETSVSDLSANGASATLTDILSIGSSNVSGTTPFSQGLLNATGLPSISLQNGEEVTTGIAANANAYVTSTSAGTLTTGSYMRDILTGLSAIASLTTGQLSDTSNFSNFVNSVSKMLTNANNDLNGDSGVLGDVQTQLSNKATSLTSMVTALTNQVGNADSVDTAAVLSQLSATQTSLEDSYQLISNLQKLNLASYL